MAALTSIMDGLSNAIVQIRFAKLRNIQGWKRENLAVLAQPRDQKRLSLPVSDPTNLLDMVTDQWIAIASPPRKWSRGLRRLYLCLHLGILG